MIIDNDVKLDYCDVLIRPKRSTLESRKDVDLHRTFSFKGINKEWTGIPIVAANMDTVGTLEMAKVLSDNDMLTCLSKHATPTEIGSQHRKNMALSFGMNEDGYDILLGKYAPFIKIAKDYSFFCLDVANGYSQKFVDFVKEVRSEWQDKIIIAGNVVTAEMTEALLLAGANIVKIGIGSGAVCTTRRVAGVGFPQLSAIMECSDSAHSLGGLVMADGGCTCPGDVAKSFGGGADFVMLGGMLSGHDECDGKVKMTNTGKKYKVFYGMSSETAMNKYHGGVATYRASEGKTIKVPYRGPVIETVKHILGGVRSACTYVGARRLKDLPKCTTFVRVNRQLNNAFEGIDES